MPKAHKKVFLENVNAESQKPFQFFLNQPPSPLKSLEQFFLFFFVLHASLLSYLFIFIVEELTLRVFVRSTSGMIELHT